MNAVLPFDADKNNAKLLNEKAAPLSSSYKVGDKKDFFVENLVTNNKSKINAQLLYSGTKANVWVHNNQISAVDAEKIGKEFDEKIYPAVTNNFAKEPDVDGDGKINILCYDIQDGYTGKGAYVASYFNEDDFYDYYSSNYSEIIYLDTYPTMGTGKTKNLTDAYSSIAHDFQHMVNFYQNVMVEENDKMVYWLDEALALAAEQAYTGRVLDDRIDYYNNSELISSGKSLLFEYIDVDPLATSSLSYLFGQYIKLQTGKGNTIFKEIIQDKNNDYKAVENVIKKYINSNLTFGKMMTNFRIALLRKDKTGLYGFKGEAGFNKIQPRVYIWAVNQLYGGGDIVNQVIGNQLKVPKNKGKNITYTFVENPVPGRPKVNAVGDNVTKVTGKTAAGAKVYVKAGSKQIGKGTANSNGDFSVSIPKQKAGNILSVYIINSYGNKSNETKVKVLDKTAPAKPKVKAIGDNSKKVTGTTEAGATVYVKAGSKQIGKGTANSKGQFSVSIPKQKAGKTLTIYAADKAKNKSKEVKIKVIDKTPPKNQLSTKLLQNPKK